jgi:hypothetical protein
MSLDFRGYDVNWSYFGFHDFRVKLAREIGIDLNQMHGFFAPWRGQKEEDFKDISWDTVSDPIKLLLDHSDCEGELSPQECALVAPRLIRLTAQWPADDYDSIEALRLASAMMDCAIKNKPLEFC